MDGRNCILINLHELVGVRYMDDETLLRQRPYQLVYSGELIAEQPLTRKNKTSRKWEYATNF